MAKNARAATNPDEAAKKRRPAVHPIRLNQLLGPFGPGAVYVGKGPRPWSSAASIGGITGRTSATTGSSSFVMTLASSSLPRNACRVFSASHTSAAPRTFVGLGKVGHHRRITPFTFLAFDSLAGTYHLAGPAG